MKKNKIIEIQEEVRIPQKDHDLILEKGDMIKVLKEEEIMKKFKPGWYSAGLNPEEDDEIFIEFMGEKETQSSIEYSFETGGLRTKKYKPKEFITRLKKPFKDDFIAYAFFEDKDSNLFSELSKYEIYDHSED